MGEGKILGSARTKDEGGVLRAGSTERYIGQESY